MTRRDFITSTSGAGLGLWAGGSALSGGVGAEISKWDSSLKLLPYPKELIRTGGVWRLGTPQAAVDSVKSQTASIALQSLRTHFPSRGRGARVRLGSVEEGYDPAWLMAEDNEFLRAAGDKPESSIVVIQPDGITVVGRGRRGMLYGVQTICQWAIEARRQKQTTLPCLRIRDWPDLRWRCLAPTLTWYSGWNRLEGYDLCNWSEGEWKWLVDWSLLHKCNAWAVCMYGYWPFTLPGYEHETLDVDSFFYNPTTRQKEAYRFTHRNIQNEFFPKVIQYANERGIKVHAYIGKNSFNGCSYRTNAAVYAGGAAEMLPFAPGVDEYWDAFIGRIIDSGFNGFVFEDPEANHVPNQNEKCFQTFWQPWGAKYNFSSVQQTQADAPPLGVHIEYYAWLFRQFSDKISRHAARVGREMETYLISHVLLARIMAESKSPQERREWIRLMDERHGQKAPFIILESDEKAYVELLGGDRVASLGGRGGSCTCAMRRIASVNNDWVAGPMGGDLAYERACQNRMVEAGGFGAMGYIFEWTNTEVFGYLAAQYLWNKAGIPGVNNSDQTGILDYAYRIYYGDEVGSLVAKAMDEGSDINDAMVLEGVYGSQYPSTGRALHRDYQFLGVLADHAESLARKAYRLFAGREPDLFNAAYLPDAFLWEGGDSQADGLFKEERLRRLWLSTRRSQEMCRAALAHRRAQRRLAQGASVGAVLDDLDRAIDYAKMNQLIYQVNYNDDYDWTDGLCSRLTAELEQMRDRFWAECSKTMRLPEGRAQPVPEALRPSAQAPVLFIPWEALPDILPSEAAAGRPGLWLETQIGLTDKEDYYRLGVVFTIEILAEPRGWRPLFRRSLQRRAKGWEKWRIPVPSMSGDSAQLRLRFVTDSYSRAQNRTAPSWQWALWGEPRLRSRQTVYDFVGEIGHARTLVRLDKDGQDRLFDGTGKDSTGATFNNVPSASNSPVIEAFTPHLGGQFGVTIGEYTIDRNRLS